MRPCNHQSLRRVSVGGIRPEGTAWYECKCGQRLLVHIIASYPRDPELEEAEEHDVEIRRRFVAQDGSDWAVIEGAIGRNKMLAELVELDGFLLPRSTELDEGDGYLQQDPDRVAEVQIRLLKLAARVYQHAVGPTTTLSQILMSEEGIEESPIYALYQRLACIDKSGREWQNSTLAENPHEGRQVPLNQAPARKPSDGFEETPNERGSEGERPSSR